MEKVMETEMRTGGLHWYIGIARVASLDSEHPAWPSCAIAHDSQGTRYLVVCRMFLGQP